MSTPQRRTDRPFPDPGKFRTLTSFLTCRIASMLPAAPEVHRSSTATGDSVRTAHERSSAYRPGADSVSPNVGSQHGRTSISDLRNRFAATSEPGVFPAGVEAELYSCCDIATGIGVPPALLRHPQIADEAQRCLHALDGVLCSLDAFVILPTHVHVLFSQRVGLLGGPSPEQVAAVFKMTVGQRANRHLGRAGEFWEKDDFHRYLPTDSERRAALDFIRRAPVRGGLVPHPDAWAWLYVREEETGTCRTSVRS